MSEEMIDEMSYKEAQEYLDRMFKEGKIEGLTYHYYTGVICGVWMYAWWKDGVQYVGTTGTTLHQAMGNLLSKMPLVPVSDSASGSAEGNLRADGMNLPSS